MGHFLVVGGSSGIGEDIIKRLSDRGDSVTSLCRRQPKQVVKVHHECDVIQDELPSVDEALNGLVYCPGSINLKPFRQLTIQDFQADLEVNLLGAVRVLQTYLPHLRKGKPASVVLFSTVAVQRGMSFHASIAAAKGAVEGLTRSLAAELAPQVRVNCIAPSLTETPLAEPLMKARDTVEKRHPLQRLGRPSDMGAMATFLLGEEAGWITGQVIGVDGGLSTLSVF